MLGLYERLLCVRVTITCGVSWSEGRRCSCFRSSPSDRRSFVLHSDPWWIIRSPPPLHLFVILVHSASLSLRWHDCSHPKVAPQPGWTGIAAQNAFLTLLTPTSLASRSLLDGSCRLLCVRLCRRLHVHFHINTSPLLQGAWYSIWLVKVFRALSLCVINISVLKQRCQINYAHHKGQKQRKQTMWFYAE